MVLSRDDTRGGGSGKSRDQLILIVEDDYLIALDLEAGLHAAGFQVAGPATTADEAINLALSIKPVLVLMDIRLLGKRDGVDAALELYRELGIRCIFTTAHGDRDLRLRAEAAKPLGWVQKPYSIATLIDAIRNGFQEIEKPS
ncbi:response regulator [Mesorhizobium sp. M4B.F.Ca.ET.215.01.1.1]|nr:response regulator [Mesorhizobium sp. M4B.F.Ca.ET.013.02.1.1]RVD45560.1 response regulator [Mesorhizobium sp. M4B.F.Ca.ET.019.03.1.1]RWF62809.1 MAG: response regulator [Mesorhizobium sp.]TGQ03918.1 response regulator [Mesorhizobium sp. M4B.F.Ca.ET.215.01.1.1]TGQ23969.1 response regulator [Mesorhizobium sp. M00.F.Ca.ET.220.01.1.1]TGQ27545.1 response regulator [Mesorhizobium sp. M4B.F.Ca.ET.214.01.1.1]TGQ54587.1 response regulator [Mesorhizobium sp. M4B.F.Ca.ET.211.01.1.1]TGQ96600.1 respons